MAKTTLIGSLKISLLAVTKPFNKGLGVATNRLQKFNRLLRTNVSTALAQAAGRLTRFGARGLGSIPGLVASATRSLLRLVKILGVTLVAAAGAATAALVLMAKNSFKELDRIAKSSRIIGIMVSELQVFEQAAKEAGVETKVLEKSLRNMTRQVNDAAKGTGEAIDALKDLGLDAKALISLSIPDQFIAIADALAEISSEGERIQIASDLFGARGLALLNLGTESLKDIDKFLEDIGGKISDFDAKKIEEANDAVSKMKLAFKSVGDQIAIRTAPIVESFANFIIDKLAAAGGVGEVVNNTIAKIGPTVAAGIDFIGTAAEGSLSFMADVLVEVGKFFDEIEDRGPTVANAFAVVIRVPVDALAIAVLAIRAATLDLAVATAVLAQETEGGVKKFIRFVGGELGKEGQFVLFRKAGEKAGEQFAEGFKDPADSAIESLAMAARISNTALEQAISGFKIKGIEPETKEFIRETSTLLRELAFSGSVTAESLAEFTKKINDAGGSSEVIAAKIQAIIDKYQGLGSTINAMPPLEPLFKDAKEEAEKLTPTIDRLETAFDDVGDGIAGALLKGENAFESLAKTAVSALNDIATALFKKGLFTALFSLFGGGATGSFFAGLAGATTTASPLQGIEPPFETGSGTVVNVNFLGPTMGDDAIREQVAKGITQAQPALTSAAVGAVSDRAQRDPNFRRAFA